MAHGEDSDADPVADAPRPDRAVVRAGKEQPVPAPVGETDCVRGFPVARFVLGDGVVWGRWKEGTRGTPRERERDDIARAELAAVSAKSAQALACGGRHKWWLNRAMSGGGVTPQQGGRETHEALSSTGCPSVRARGCVPRADGAVIRPRVEPSSVGTQSEAPEGRHNEPSGDELSSTSKLRRRGAGWAMRRRTT